jgi:hypothetical protein
MGANGLSRLTAGSLDALDGVEGEYRLEGLGGGQVRDVDDFEGNVGELEVGGLGTGSLVGPPGRRQAEHLDLPICQQRGSPRGRELVEGGSSLPGCR